MQYCSPKNLKGSSLFDLLEASHLRSIFATCQHCCKPSCLMAQVHTDAVCGATVYDLIVCGDVQRQSMRHGWNPADDVNPAASSLFEGRKDWVDVLTAHVQMLRFVCRGETEQACEHTEALVTPFNKVSEPLLSGNFFFYRSCQTVRTWHVPQSMAVVAWRLVARS